MIPEIIESLLLTMKSGASVILYFYCVLEIQPNDLQWKFISRTKTNKQTIRNHQKKPPTSILMNIFLIQTIKASGLSIRLKAVRLLAKRDVSVSHNLMYTFRQFHGSFRSYGFFFIWDLFQLPP